MSNQQHPITPPDELVQEWAEEHRGIVDGSMYVEEYIVIQTSRFRQIADAELEACCADIHVVYGQQRADWLREMRRPKPPSLAEQALKALDEMNKPLGVVTGRRCDTIRAALKRLQELEQRLD